MAVGDGSKGWKAHQKDAVTMPQAFSKELTVAVWKNALGVSKAGLRSMQHPGHAALLLRMEKEEDVWRVFPSQSKAKTEFSRQTFSNEVYKYRYFSFFPSSRDLVNQQKETEKGPKNTIMSARGGYFCLSYINDMISEISRDTVAKLRRGEFFLRKGQKYLGSIHVETVEEESDEMETVFQFGLPIERPIKKLVKLHDHYFGVAADETVSLRVQSSAGKAHIGVNAHLLCKAANDFKSSDHFAYMLISPKQNCSGVACRLMEAGGCTAFCSIPSVAYKPQHFFFTSPRNALEYARATERAITALNAMIDDLINRYMASNQYHLSRHDKISKDSVQDLYHPKIWKDRSAASWSHRSVTLKKIDRELENYHQCTWGEDYNKKLSAFCKIIYYVHHYSRSNKKSRRGDAFAMLVLQIVTVIQRRFMQLSARKLPPERHYSG